MSCPRQIESQYLYPPENRSTGVLFPTDIYKVKKSNEKEAIFPIEIWNQNQETSEGLMRTTNSVEEGWHWGVSALFQGSHPSIIAFSEKIRLDVSNQQFNLLEATTGKVNRGQNKISRGR